MRVPTHLPPRPYVVSADDDAPAVWGLGNLWRVMATGVQTDNAFCLIDQVVTPDGGGPCTHLHAQDEGLYVVSGHCTFNAAGQTMAAGPGTLAVIPRNTEHSFRADGVDTRLLNFYLPAGFEILLLGLCVPAQENELPPPGVQLPPRRLVEKLSAQVGALPILGLPFADPPRDDNMATRPTLGATAHPFISSAAEAPSWWTRDGLWSVLADGTSTDGSYSMFERLVGSGMGEPPPSTSTPTRCSTCWTATSTCCSPTTWPPLAAARSRSSRRGACTACAPVGRHDCSPSTPRRASSASSPTSGPAPMSGCYLLRAGRLRVSPRTVSPRCSTSSASGSSRSPTRSSGSTALDLTWNTAVFAARLRAPDWLA